MSLHLDPHRFAHSERDAPTLRHKLIAASITTLPATTVLAITLWTVADTCAGVAGFGWTAAMIFAGFFPFSLTKQLMPGTATAARMRLGQVALLSTFFALFVLFGPGPVFLGVPCGNGPTVLQSGLLVLSITWTSWWAMRAVATQPA